MKKGHVLEQGFTLIEIIIVLVLLGILAATAVPKYYDLQEVAQARAAQSAVAELQAQVNLTFANALMKGDACGSTTDGNTALGKAAAHAKQTDAVTGWTFAFEGTTGSISSVAKKADNGTATFTINKDKFSSLLKYTPTIVFPTCEANTSTPSDK